ncbi:MAG: C4-dicarboxylate ABC transporter [Candidatus Dactylopiibacterium carminicum]|nr:MAG: C4-dicarboxylate ABC transporter [Candidatus Dactylopiibacterium carminicum]
MTRPKALLSALVTVALLATAPAGALELRSGDSQPEGYPTVLAVQDLGRKLAAATGNRLTLKVFPNGELGDEKSMIAQTQAGTLDMLRVSLGPVGVVVPEVDVFNLPFVFRDEAHMRKVIDGEIGDELLDRITDSTANLVALGWMDAGARSLYARKPIRSPLDLAGQKIRMIGNPLFIETLNAMGGSGIALGWNEVYNALQTGVVDGAENNVSSYVSAGHLSITRVFSFTEHLIVPELLVFSKLQWNKLSPEDRALIRKLARETQLKERELWIKRVALDTLRMKSAGVVIVTDVDRQAFYKATQAVRDKYGNRYADLLRRIAAVK